MLVFGDTQSVFGKLGQPTAYIQDSGMVADEPVIKRFAVRVETRTNRITRRDYDSEKPRLLLEAAVKDATYQQPSGTGFRRLRLPRPLHRPRPWQHLSQRALERHRADYQPAEGRSDQPSLCSGHLLEISEHPRREWNALWLLTEVRHEGKMPQVLEESVTSDVQARDGFTQGYRNHFTATPWDGPSPVSG